MRALITGGAGFIGSAVAEFLINQGHSVLVIDDLSGGSEDNIPKGCLFEKKSILENLNPIFSSFKPDVVYHLAAYAAEGLSHHIPIFNYKNNLQGTVNVLTNAYNSSVKHFVFTSSIAAYGHPDSASTPFNEEMNCKPCDPYGIAKLACEQHIGSFFSYYGSPNYTIFRPHNVFGPRQNISDPYRNVVGIFISQCLKNLPMTIFGDGNQTRSFSYISTVAEAIATSPSIPAAISKTINIGGDIPTSVSQLALTISKLLGVEPKIEYLESRKEVMHAHCDHSLARQIFSEAYKNDVTIEQGLKNMIAYVKTKKIPISTECPSDIEIGDKLPPSWLLRLQSQSV
jgi:UDP-glucose 4-epimerase